MARPTADGPRCPRCGEQRLVEFDRVLRRWICSVCSQQWPRADARRSETTSSVSVSVAAWASPLGEAAPAARVPWGVSGSSPGPSKRTPCADLPAGSMPIWIGRYRGDRSSRPERSRVATFPSERGTGSNYPGGRERRTVPSLQETLKSSRGVTANCSRRAASGIATPTTERGNSGLSSGTRYRVAWGVS